MSTRAVIATAIAALLAAAPAAAQDYPAINDPNPAHFTVYGVSPPPKSVVDEAVQGERALPVAAPGKGEPYLVTVNVPLTAPVKAGDHITIYCFAKLAVADPGVTTASINAQLQLAAAPYTPLFTQKLDVPTSWKLFVIEGVVDRSYKAGEVNATFHLNTGHHTIAIGMVKVEDHGK